MKYEKIILFWCKCPPVIDDGGKQIFSTYASGVKGVDEDFDPELDMCDVCNSINKKKKLIKRRIQNDKIVDFDEVIDYV